MKLQHIKKEWDKYLAIRDPWVIDVILATLIGNSQMPNRDSIWMMLVAKSSGGKTTLLRPIDGIPGVTFLDDLTENTFLSGFNPGKGKPQTSLLQMMGSGILAFSDFTTILSKNPLSRGVILSQMRTIADGNMTKFTGKGIIPPWKGKIGFLGAATPSIYFHLEQGRAMGERFSYYWIDQPTDEDIANKQREVKISATELQAIMAPMYREYFDDIKEWVEKNGLPEFKMTDKQFETLKITSIFCVNAKATVHTNFKTGKVDKIPDQAGVGRDNSNFTALLHTFQLMDCYENDNVNYPISDDRISLIQKCAYSSIDRERRKILEVLSESDEPLTASQIGSRDGLGLEKEAVEMYLSPLHAVGIIKKEITGKNFKWAIRDPRITAFIKDVSGIIQDPLADNDEDILPEEEEDEASKKLREAGF